MRMTYDEMIWYDTDLTLWTISISWSSNHGYHGPYTGSCTFCRAVWPAANFPKLKGRLRPWKDIPAPFSNSFGVMKPCWILIYKCHAMFIHLDDLIPGTLFISFHEKLGLGSHLEHYWTIEPQPQAVHERQRSRKPKRKPPELWSERAAWRPLVKVL